MIRSVSLGFATIFALFVIEREVSPYNVRTVSIQSILAGIFVVISEWTW